jgi:hypothetical protein
MGRGLSRETRALVDVIEGMLNHGAGDLTPELDDMAIGLRSAAVASSLAEAQMIVRTRLRAALKVLENDGWVWVKVTRHYIDRYKGRHPDHPTLDDEIDHCAAISASPTAIHFCAHQGKDCILFVRGSIHGIASGEGATGATVERMRIAADTGLLSIDGVETIAGAIPKHTTIGTVRRIAAAAE